MKIVGATPDAQVTIAHTLIIWVLQTSVWVIFALALLANLGINIKKGAQLKTDIQHAPLPKGPAGHGSQFDCWFDPGGR